MKVGLFTDTYFPQTSGVATSIQTLKRELERTAGSGDYLVAGISLGQEAGFRYYSYPDGVLDGDYGGHGGSKVADPCGSYLPHLV